MIKWNTYITDPSRKSMNVHMTLHSNLAHCHHGPDVSTGYPDQYSLAVSMPQSAARSHVTDETLGIYRALGVNNNHGYHLRTRLLQDHRPDMAPCSGPCPDVSMTHRRKHWPPGLSDHNTGIITLIYFMILSGKRH